MNAQSTSVEARLEGLSAERVALLERLLEMQLTSSAGITCLPRSETEGPLRLPTSTAQRRLWFIDQLEGSSTAYHIGLSLRLHGQLDREALQRALDALVRRHEILRTTFVVVDGEPVQQIAHEASFVLRTVDLSGGAPSEREAQVCLHRREEAARPFDLAAGPLIRGRLLRVRSGEHVLLITMHHIVSDGWSLSVLFRELTSLYQAQGARRGDPLPPLRIQYADYAHWQRQLFQERVLERQLDYWRQRLAEAPRQLELPADRPRPAVQSYRGENLPVTLDAHLTRSLKAFAQRHEMTLFMVLYAAWALLLSRLSGQDDIVIGTPVANRQHPELEPLIGFFVNTLALRAAMPADRRLEDFLKEVKELTLGAYAHQDVPFEKIVEALQPERTLSRNPLFQVLFALRTAPTSELRMPGLTVTLEEEVYESAMFDLMISLQERGDQIIGFLNYATDLFDRATVERWLGYYGMLLRSMLDGSHSLLAELPILPEAERQQVLEAFNTTKTPWPRERLIHEVFEQQVARTPEALAVEHQGRSLSYGELNARANQLAGLLREQGVGPDRLVAVCLERSPEMLVSLLAIVKAGGAYLPLDPSYPAERLQQMLEDATPPLLLTQAALASRLPATTAQVIVLESAQEPIAAQPDGDRSASEMGLTSDHLLYVIYTSGSTGRPKGTAMPHRSMVNLLEWHRREFGQQAGTRVLQFAALSFDVAFQEAFTTLCTGGTLVLLDEWLRRDARALNGFLSEQRIERLFVPPLMLQSLAESCQASGHVPGSLKDVITAGEQLRISPEIVGLFRKLPGCRLHNHYGPTETHVVTALTLSGDAAEWPALPPIGKPIANTQVYVLDGRMEPLPIGVTGELYLGGANLARGYLHRPELTVERFIPDPFSTERDARLYKTGDLGRWRADGTLEYVGRNDDQVKIRGFRIELGEIEAQLARHPQVKETTVVAREEAPGQKRLVAYVVPRVVSPAETPANPNVEELRTHLKTVLPEHMVPSAFVTLEKLPLTPSGKLDRRALPAPDRHANVTREYEPPQGEIEQLLAGIWQELLKVERVGRHDNFFALGGHSLLIVRLLERLRQVGLTADVREVYRSTSLAELAGKLTGSATQELEMPPNRIPPHCQAITPEMLTLVQLSPEHIARIVRAVPGGAANIQDIYPLTPLQEGILFHRLLGVEQTDV